MVGGDDGLHPGPLHPGFSKNAQSVFAGQTQIQQHDTEILVIDKIQSFFTRGGAGNPETGPFQPYRGFSGARVGVDNENRVFRHRIPLEQNKMAYMQEQAGRLFPIRLQKFNEYITGISPWLVFV
jgi:hypothetical protein